MAGENNDDGAATTTARERILATATAEFLGRGFSDASLRRIAAAAGVTTGAVYGHFSGKASLFDAIVEGPAEELYRRYVASQEAFYDRPLEEQSFEAMRRLEDELTSELYGFVFDHRDAFLLVLTRSAGTRWEGYLDRFADIESASTARYVREMGEKGVSVRAISEPMARTLARQFFVGFFQPLVEGMDRAQALVFVAEYSTFYHAGYAALMTP